MSAMKRRVLYAKDLHDALGIAPDTARKWLRERRLGPVVRVGRKLGIRPETLDAYLELREAESRGQEQLDPEVAAAIRRSRLRRLGRKR